MRIDLHFNVSLDVTDTCKLMEMTTKSIPCMVKSLVASRDEGTSFDYVMSVIKSRSSEVFIDRMDVELAKGIHWGDGVLPDISDDVIELACFEHVDRVGTHPIFKVDVTN